MLLAFGIFFTVALIYSVLGVSFFADSSKGWIAFLFISYMLRGTCPLGIHDVH